MSQTAPNTREQADKDVSFSTSLRKLGRAPLTRAPLQELQINIGRLCNQACNHCHVDAGPKRTEIMSWPIMEKILAWARKSRITAADITGGSPELNPNFRRLVDGLLDAGVSVKARCNLTVLLDPGQEDQAHWYAERGVHLICSLPCYSAANVDAQRGKGVFTKSITALKLLNGVGYAGNGALQLDLVYNPGGAFLPPVQQNLEEEYRQRLRAEHGVYFNQLLTLTNLPISRFRHFLERSGQLAGYQQLLVENFNSDTINGLMCRYLISVDWRGRVYDCDFNQMLDLPLAVNSHHYLWDIDTADLENRPIAVDNHCFGCTAGAGSSCGGALV